MYFQQACKKNYTKINNMLTDLEWSYTFSLCFLHHKKTKLESYLSPIASIAIVNTFLSTEK